MGASKEGMMSVRDKINLVLNNFFEEDEGEEEDSESPSREGQGQREGISLKDNVPTTAPSKVNFNSPSSSSSSLESVFKQVTAESLTLNSCSDLGVNKSICGGGEGEGVASGSSQNDTRTGGDVDGGDHVILEDNSIIVIKDVSERGRSKDVPVPEGQEEEGHEEGEGGSSQRDCLILEGLLMDQLRLIQSLQERLSNTESAFEAVIKERDQLQETLNCERQQNALLQTQLKSESEATIKSRDERIQELERKLAEATAPKPTQDKETCVTPPPPPPPPPVVSSPTPPRDPISHRPYLTEDDHQDYELDPPLRKRQKLDYGHGGCYGYESSPSSSPSTSQNFLSPPPPPPSTSSSSFYSFHRKSQPKSQRRSDSPPPHLSPAVTPKSCHKNSSSRTLREMMTSYHLGQEVNDFDGMELDSLHPVPDEFQEELEIINRLNSSHSKQSCSSSIDSSSRPPFQPKPRHTRFMFPECRKRISNSNSSNSNSSFLPVNSSNKLRLNQSDDSSPSSPTIHSSKSNHHGVQRNLKNNFLNLSRPLAKKAPVVIVPPPPQSQQSHPPSSSSPYFRSLDGGAVTSSSSSTNSSHFLHDEDQSITPHQTKKRKVGRPPGSGLKSKLHPSPRFSTTPKKGHQKPKHQQNLNQLLNGSIRPQELMPVSLPVPPPPPPPPPPVCPPPPQRFSRSGRLLKPNRARYSPDPDVTVNTRENKYMTTKRGYFIGDPFNQSGIGVAFPPGGIGGDLSQNIQESPASAVGGIQLSSTATELIPFLPPLAPPPPTSSSTTPLSLPPPSGEIKTEKLEVMSSTETERQFSASAEYMEDIESVIGGGDEARVTIDESVENESQDPESLLFVEVPKWRVNIVEGYSEFEVKPVVDDDMSEEAFLKRHQKLEAKEKQRKRWDSQRMREESYLERLKRKQEERERLKELRRQQRKRNKGVIGASEEETVTPNTEEIKAIHVGKELPVGAFGHPLPLVEKVDFNLAWQVTPIPPSPTPSSTITIATKKISTPTPPPLAIKNDNEDIIIDLSEDDKKKVPLIDSIEMEISSSESDEVIPPPSSPSSTSKSSLLIILGNNSPSPPLIFPEEQEDKDKITKGEEPDDLEDKNDDNGNSDSCSQVTVTTDCTTDCEDIETDEVEDELEDLDDESINGLKSLEEDSPESPIFSVDLVDYVNTDDSIFKEDEDVDHTIVADSSQFINDESETCDISASQKPSISIPLTPTASPSKTSASNSSQEINGRDNNDAKDSASSTGNEDRSRSNELKSRNSTVVRFPMSFPITASSPSSSSSTSSQSSSPSSSSSSSQVSKTSITFFIPNNPLAPSRTRRRSASSQTPTTAASTPSSASSPIKSSTSICRNS